MLSLNIFVIDTCWAYAVQLACHWLVATFDFILIFSDQADQIFINFESSYNLTKSYFLSSIAVITCPTLPTPTHGTKLGCHWNVMYYGTVCHFSCNDGFIGSGSQEDANAMELGLDRTLVVKVSFQRSVSNSENYV